MQLTFRVGETDRRRGLAIAAFVVVGLMWPLAFGAWYVYGDGLRSSHVRSLARYGHRDAEQDARQAIRDGDLRRVVIRDGLDEQLPGGGYPTSEERERFGYRHLILLRHDDLTAEEEAANDAARAYALTYNRVIVGVR